LVESQFRIISKSYNFLFGTTATQSFTFSTSHFFSGQSWHTSSSSIVLYLWLGDRRLTAGIQVAVILVGQKNDGGNVFQFMKLEELMAGDDSKPEGTYSKLAGTHFTIGKIKI
jgi:hypothetical protein